MPRNQIGDTVSGEVRRPPNQVGNRRVGPISGAEVPPKQVRDRTPVSVPPPSKQRKDQSVRTVSGGAALPTQVGGRTPVCRRSKKDYRVYLNQLPGRPDVDISTKLDAVQLKELNVRHALYRLKYYQLSQNVPEDKLCYDKLKEDYPPSRLEKESFFKCYEEDGKLGWSFHPDYCQLAGLEDYQRLVPRNYGGYEYVDWDEYHKEFNSYEIEQEYVKYCEELSKKLKWMEAYVLKEQTSLMRGMILTRGTYQAMKIATDFLKIHANLAFSGFYEWFKSMAFDVTNYKEFDVLYYETWQRCNQEVSNVPWSSEQLSNH
ncbi:uncharacterized protein [Triticum aestivum]|uniref:uncharacterized protein n=1 Tax=Triticum aestivum TaxID=4565 RepID=UPI001D0093EF|nr:uncharacterized protein LOC123157101 [Triticum aestivum]